MLMRRKKKTIECIEYLSVSAPLDKVDRLEDKQSKYIHEYVKNKEWHDNVWGNCECERCKETEGKNLLGKALMEVRSKLK